MFELAALTSEDATVIASWRYDPPYDTYDVGPEDVPGLTDPTGRYSTVRRRGELIAYVCLGAEARVTGLGPAADTEDLGFGLRPDLMGQGLSGELFPWLIPTVQALIGGHELRVVILDWNARSLAAYRQAGFADVGDHINEDGRYLLLTRPAATASRHS